MCVSNQAAAAELLADPAVADLLRGRTLIQMTTGTPADGRRNADWAQPLGIGYVDAAILAYPREIGTPDAEIFYCGPAAAPEAAPELGPLLGALGTVHFVGEDAGRASVVDAALIAFFYGTMAGFVQCVNLATAEGVPIGELLPLSGPFFSRFIAQRRHGDRRADHRAALRRGAVVARHPPRRDRPAGAGREPGGGHRHRRRHRDQGRIRPGRGRGPRRRRHRHPGRPAAPRPGS